MLWMCDWDVTKHTIPTDNTEEVDNIKKESVDLSSGVTMKALWSVPYPPTRKQNDKELPPLIFLHGSFHGAWCWAKKFFPYFTSLGYHVAAVNWRGTGGTFAGEGVKKVKMDKHVQDLSAFLEEFVPKLAPSSTKKELKPIYSHKPLLWWFIHYEIWNIWKNTRRRVWTI